MALEVNFSKIRALVLRRSPAAGGTGKVPGILRYGGARGRRLIHVSWLPELVEDAGPGTAEAADKEDQRQRDADIDARERWMKMYTILRLPALTYEQLAIPMRIAYPRTFLSQPLVITLDVVLDIYEILYIATKLRSESALRQAVKGRGASTDVQSTAYTSVLLVRDIGAICVLHVGRIAYMAAGSPYLWIWGQLARLVRVIELGHYVQVMNNDLTTNVMFLAVYKFSLVLYSVPHWIACGWWVISERRAEPLELPSWSAQFELFTGNQVFNPAQASDGERYVLSLYMAWAGLTAMGYGRITITSAGDLVFAITITMVQIVFYAFVLGTLFHYLVRTDENTAKYKELMKAVGTYCFKHSLGTSVTKEITSHFAFQHKKQASSTATIFAQMPMSLKVRVSSARYFKQVQAAWVFQSVSHQFLNQIVTFLRERFVMPNETLFNQGDGSRELLWVIGGSVQLRKNDLHYGVIRSDINEGNVLSELGFFLGLQQPFTATATSAGDVTLLVLNSSDYESVMVSYPEQSTLIVSNVLRRFGLDQLGNDADAPTGLLASASEEEQQEFEELRQLIKQVMVDRNEEAITQMSYAAKDGDAEAVRALASKGLDLNAKNYDDRTTLHLAAAEGNTKVVALLCELGADPNMKDRWGMTATELAITQGHGQVARELQRHGGELRMERPEALLMEAVQQSRVRDIEELLSLGFNLNDTDYDGRSPLHLASAAGNMRVVEFLISSLADVNVKDRWGNMPVDDALSNEHRLVAQVQMERGARPNTDLLFDKLCLAAAAGDAERVRFLVDSGAPVAKGDYDSRTPLHLAVCARSVSTTHFLIGATADARAEDRWGSPAIVDAINNSSEVAGLLIHHCNAQLPERYELDPAIQKAFQDARGHNMYTTSMEMGRRKLEHMEHSANLRLSRRDIELELKALLNSLSDYMDAHRKLFGLLTSNIDDWIVTYAADRSDIDSQEDLDELEVDSSESSHSGIEDADSDNDGHAQGEDTSDQGRGKDFRTDHDAAKVFLRVVLQLPKAEAGLKLMRDAFLVKLNPVMRERLPAQVRRQEESAALRDICVSYLGLEPDIAQKVLDEIFAQLAEIFGPAAPGKDASQAVHSMPPELSVSLNRAQAGMMSCRSSYTSGGADVQGGESVLRSRPVSLLPWEADDTTRCSKRISTELNPVQTSPTRRHCISCICNGMPKELEDGLSDHALTNNFTVKGNRSGAARYDSQRFLFLSDLGFVVLCFSESFIKVVAAMQTPDEEQVPGGEPVDNMSKELREGTISSSFRRAFIPKKIRAPYTGAEANKEVTGGDVASSQCALAQCTPSRARVVRGDIILGLPGKCKGLLSEEQLDDGKHGDNEKQLCRANHSHVSVSQVPSVPVPVVHAVQLLAHLFQVFDRRGKGKIRVRDIKTLQSALGELGGNEIKSLMDYLLEAASAFTHMKPKQTQLAKVKDPHGAGFSDADIERGEKCAMTGSGDMTCASKHSERSRRESESNHTKCQRKGSIGTAAPFARKGSIASTGIQIRKSSTTSVALSESHEQPEKLTSLSRTEFFVGAVAWILGSGEEEGDVKDRAGLAASSGPAGIPMLAMRRQSTAKDKMLEADDDVLQLDLIMTTANIKRVIARAQLQMDRGHLQAHDIVSAKELVHIMSASITSQPPTQKALNLWCQLRLELEIVVDKAAGVAGGSGGHATWIQFQKSLDSYLQRRTQEISLELERASVFSRAAHAVRDAIASVSMSLLTTSPGISQRSDEADLDSARPWWILTHTSTYWHLIHRLFLTFVVWDALTLPVYLSFAQESLRMPWIWSVSYLIDFYYMARVGLRFCTTFVNEKSATVFDPVAIRWHYLGTDFPVDFVANWPHDLFALAFGVDWLTVTALRCVKLVNLRYVLHSYKQYASKAGDHLLHGLVQYLGLIFVTGHLCACLLNVLGYSPAVVDHVASVWPLQFWDSASEVNSMMDDVIDPESNWSAEIQLGVKYLVSMFMVLSVMTTLGLSQLPANYVEVAYFLFMMFLNYTVYAFAVGKISALVMKLDDEIVSKRGQLELVQVYLQQIRVPRDLKTQIEAFFHARLEETSLSSVTDEQIYDSLPVSLQIEVSSFTNRSLVGECALFRRCAPGFVDRLSSMLRTRIFQPETNLFNVSEVCRELFIVETGGVEIFDEGEGDGAPVEVMHAGDTIAELPFVFSMRHVNNARSASDTETKAHFLTAERYRLLLKSFPKEEDVIMDNVIHSFAQAHGAFSARSGVSGKSGKSRGIGKNDDAMSKTSGKTHKTDAAGAEADSIERVIAAAKKKRNDLQVVRACGSCAKGDFDKVSSIITTAGYDVDRGDYNGRRPLHVASCCGHVKIVELLLGLDADVNVVDRNGVTPLHDALLHHQATVATVLIKRGAKRLYTAVADRLCHVASTSTGKTELNYLVGFETADVNAKNYDSRTALHLASASGHAENVRLLLEHQAEVNAQDRRGSTALQEAFSGGHSSCIKLLLEHNANMGVFDVGVQLCTAASTNDVGMLERILECRCDVNEGDYDKRTALHLAASFGHVDAAHFLLKVPGIDPNAEDRYGNTALDDAMRETGPDVPIILTLLQSRGGKQGSHVAVADGSSGDPEVEVVRSMAEKIQEHRSLLPSIVTMKEWATTEAKSTRLIRRQVEEVLALERAEGGVITDRKPGFWKDIQAFAAGHQGRFLRLLELQGLAARWHEDTLQLASQITQDLLHQVSALTQALATSRQPMEAISEAQFLETNL